MPDFLKTTIFAGPSISPGTVAIRLVAAAVLGAVVAWIYRRTRKGAEISSSFPVTLVLLSILIAMVTQVIGDNVARAFSLVGALSIVRFRTAIKEPEELAYLFVAIAIGLGYGANQGQITFAAFIFIVAVLWFRSLILRRSTNQNLNMLISAPSSLGITVEQVMDVLTEHCAAVQLRRLDQDSDKMEASFMVEFEGFESFQKCRQALHALNENLSISFLDNRGLS